MLTFSKGDKFTLSAPLLNVSPIVVSSAVKSLPLKSRRGEMCNDYKTNAWFTSSSMCLQPCNCHNLRAWRGKIMKNRAAEVRSPCIRLAQWVMLLSGRTIACKWNIRHKIHRIHKEGFFIDSTKPNWDFKYIISEICSYLFIRSLVWHKQNVKSF